MSVGMAMMAAPALSFLLTSFSMSAWTLRVRSMTAVGVARCDRRAPAGDPQGLLLQILDIDLQPVRDPLVVVDHGVQQSVQGAVDVEVARLDLLEAVAAVPDQPSGPVVQDQQEGRSGEAGRASRWSSSSSSWSSTTNRCDS